MKAALWIPVFVVVTATATGACSSTTTQGTAGSAGSNATSSSGAGGNGGEGTSSSSSGMGGSSSFAACTDTTGSLRDCKNCCDCASQLSCQDQRSCRDTCNALGDTVLMMNPNPMPVVVPSPHGTNGDYTACTSSTTTEQDCKTCCDCTMNFACGDHQYCRNACIATFGDGGLPPPPPDGG